jgi:hypothetical protein
MATTEKQLPMLGGLPITKVAERIHFIKAMIYAMNGVGKTRLAASASLVPEMCPVLMLDVEGGTKSIRNIYPEVDVVRIKDVYDDKGKLLTSAWAKLGEVYEDLKKGGKYKTIIVDSLTEIQQLSMVNVLRNEFAKNSERDPELPQLRDYGKVNIQIRKFVRAMRDLDAHVIFTALEQQAKDDRTGKMYIRPSLPGKLADEVPAFLDEVFYMKVDWETDKQTKERTPVRYLLAQPDGTHVAKDRSDALPLYLTNPTMADIAAFVLDSDDDKEN